jgi:hypothetical protein
MSTGGGTSVSVISAQITTTTNTTETFATTRVAYDVTGRGENKKTETSTRHRLKDFDKFSEINFSRGSGAVGEITKSCKCNPPTNMFLFLKKKNDTDINVGGERDFYGTCPKKVSAVYNWMKTDVGCTTRISFHALIDEINDILLREGETEETSDFKAKYLEFLDKRAFPSLQPFKTSPLFAALNVQKMKRTEDQDAGDEDRKKKSAKQEKATERELLDDATVHQIMTDCLNIGQCKKFGYPPYGFGFIQNYFKKQGKTTILQKQNFEKKKN